jgi:hypothetical protein
MIAEILVGCAVLSLFSHKKRGTRVRNSKNIFGCRYREVSGECFSCNGTGKVHGKRCYKCGGSGRYLRTIWRPKKGEVYVGTEGIYFG